jgi:hypothetical protein
MHRNRAKLCVMDEWNKPPYIPSHVSNSAIFKLSHHIIPENSSISIATRLNNIFTRLQVTALTNNKRVLLT